jgi:hypothetical protein
MNIAPLFERVYKMSASINCHIIKDEQKKRFGVSLDGYAQRDSLATTVAI